MRGVRSYVDVSRGSLQRPPHSESLGAVLRAARHLHVSQERRDHVVRRRSNSRLRASSSVRRMSGSRARFFSRPAASFGTDYVCERRHRDNEPDASPREPHRRSGVRSCVAASTRTRWMTAACAPITKRKPQICGHESARATVSGSRGVEAARAVISPARAQAPSGLGSTSGPRFSGAPGFARRVSHACASN